MSVARLFTAAEIVVVLAIATRLLLPSNMGIAVPARNASVHVELMSLRWFIPLVLVVIAGALSVATIAVAYAQRTSAAIRLFGK
jgi:hypothetical protein